MTIDHCYWKCDYEYHHARQVEKKALKSHSWKQDKTSFACNAIASQNKANTSLVALSVKSFPSNTLFPTLKKQFNSPQMNLFSKLANNSKLTSDKCKKYLKNNLCFYCSARDYKLDSCLKKQTMITPKGHNASAATNPSIAVSKKPLGKQKATPRTLHRLRAVLNFPVQQQVPSDSTHPLFLILTFSLSLLLLS